jgi:RNA polymerase sigma-70 factor (ECF subfamily)
MWSRARGVGREEPAAFAWPRSWAGLLAGLHRLATPDRELLVMRYLEDLTLPEVAAILGIGEGAAQSRHLGSLQRIRVLMVERDGPEP